MWDVGYAIGDGRYAVGGSLTRSGTGFTSGAVRRILFAAFGGALGSLAWDAVIAPRLNITGYGLVAVRAVYFGLVIVTVLKLSNFLKPRVPHESLTKTQG